MLNVDKLENSQAVCKTAGAAVDRIETICRARWVIGNACQLGGEMTRREQVKETNRGFQKAMIQCANCTTAALLMVEDLPLCGNCIVEQTEDREPEWIVAHTRPLSPPLSKTSG